MRCVVAILLLAACSAAGAAEPASEVVLRLYRDFAWEAVLAQPADTGLAQQPEAALLSYFTPELAHALAADAACASRRQEVCALDFLPLWASQDPGAYDLSVAMAGPHAAQATYVSPHTGKATTLRFELAPTKAGWRVSDIVYSSGPSLAQLLSAKPK